MDPYRAFLNRAAKELGILGRPNDRAAFEAAIMDELKQVVRQAEGNPVVTESTPTDRSLDRITEALYNSVNGLDVIKIQCVPTGRKDDRTLQAIVVTYSNHEREVFELESGTMGEVVTWIDHVLLEDL